MNNNNPEECGHRIKAIGQNDMSNYLNFKVMGKEIKNLPRKQSWRIASDLKRDAEFFIMEWNAEIKPILAICGYLDDEHIRHYIRSISTEDIYKDLCEKDTANLKLAEGFAVFKGENLWDLFRDPDCKVDSPREKGFVFKSMPLAYEALRDKWIRCIYPKDGRLYISNEIIQEESTITAELQRCELYDFVLDFCKKLKANYPDEKNVHALFGKDNDGNLFPNENGILWKKLGII